MNNQKSVLRLTIAMFLFVGLVGIWMSGCENRIQEQKVERLIRQLQDRDPNVRGNAAITLGQIGSEDEVYVLMQTLQHDQDAEVRKGAILALGSIGSEAVDAVPVLIQALKDQDRRVRGSAAYALGRIGTPEAIKAVEDAVSTLIQALKDQDTEVRANATEILGMVGESAVPALMQALQHDQDAKVRKGAILALGSIGSEDVVPTLIQALNDQSVSVRGNAAKVLDSISTIYPEALKAVKKYQFRQ